MPREERSKSWHARFFGRLDPAEQVGELLFGLIMVLTFTLSAGIGLVSVAILLGG